MKKNRHPRVCAAAAPARPTTSRTHRPSAPPRSGKFAADRPRSSGPGCSFPHFSQRRTVSRGACICSSASRSRRRFPTAAAAPPFARTSHSAMAHLLDRCGTFRLPTAISTQQAVHFGTQTPAAYSQRGARLIIMACRLDRCGTLLPADRDFHSAGGAFRHADVRGLFTAWRSAYYNGVSSRSLRHPFAGRPRFPLSRRRISARRRPRPIHSGALGLL